MSNHTYDVRSLDVWGNSEDGYNVNDSFRIGKVELSDNATAKEILRALKDEGFIDKYVKITQCDIQNNDEYLIEINERKTGKPVLQLHLDDL